MGLGYVVDLVEYTILEFCRRYEGMFLGEEIDLVAHSRDGSVQPHLERYEKKERCRCRLNGETGKSELSVEDHEVGLFCKETGTPLGDNQI